MAARTTQPLLRLLRYGKPYRVQIGGAIACSVLLHFLTTVLFVGGTFIALAPGVSWWAMAPIPFVIWGTSLFQARLKPRYADVQFEDITFAYNGRNPVLKNLSLQVLVGSTIGIVGATDKEKVPSSSFCCASTKSRVGAF